MMLFGKHVILIGVAGAVFAHAQEHVQKRLSSLRPVTTT
jgi:hypothetical protein